MGKLVISDEDFIKAAVKFDRQLLKIPVLALRQAIAVMTLRTGVTGTELVGHETVSAEFAPYKANRKTDVDLEVELRPLTTYFGTLNAEFEPNESISTLLGHRASQSQDGALSQTVTAREVLGLVAKSAGEKLYDNLWSARRNASGSTTADLFNGFDTITAAEIEDGAISADAGNLIVLEDEITRDNACEAFEVIWDAMSPKLQGQTVFCYCSQSIMNAYNRNYKKTSGGQVYNNEYKQTVLEGSDGKFIFCPMPCKSGSDFITISTRKNMLIGVDQESDAERVSVKDYAPDTLTLMMRMFFGTQFRTLHPSQLMVAKLHKDPAVVKP